MVCTALCCTLQLYYSIQYYSHGITGAVPRNHRRGATESPARGHGITGAVPRNHRRGATELRHGAMELLRHGATELLRHGATELLRHGATELQARCHGMTGAVPRNDRRGATE